MPIAKLKERRKTLVGALETTYATDAEPTGPLNAVLTRNFELSPLEGETLQRELDKGTFGSDPGTLVGTHARLTFEVEMAGAVDPGDIPAYGFLLEASCHEVSLDDDLEPTEVYYDPIDDDEKSATFYYLQDQNLYKVVGARGSLTMTASKRQYGYMRFEFMALILDYGVGDIPDPDRSAFVKPVPFRASTVDFELFSQPIPLHNLTVNGGQEISFYEDSEDEELVQADRGSTFEANIRMPLLSDWNLFQAIRDDEVGNLVFALGVEAGNIFVITAPKVQPNNSPNPGDEVGISAITLSGPVIADEDEAVIKTGYRITVK